MTRGHRSIKVLLVEDNPGDARLIREMLASAPGVRPEVEHVDRLAPALARLARGGTDVVLLDLRLPDSDGLETLVRAQACAPDVAIVVLSALDDERLAVTAVREGAQDYLVKGHVAAESLASAPGTPSNASRPRPSSSDASDSRPSSPTSVSRRWRARTRGP